MQRGSWLPDFSIFFSLYVQDSSVIEFPPYQRSVFDQPVERFLHAKIRIPGEPLCQPPPPDALCRIRSTRVLIEVGEYLRLNLVDIAVIDQHVYIQVLRNFTVAFEEIRRAGK